MKLVNEEKFMIDLLAWTIAYPHKKRPSSRSQMESK